MADRLLLIDVPYLAWRAYHAIGPLSHEGQQTEVFFGLLRDIEYLRAKFFDFTQGQLIFTFDHGPLKRKHLYPEYKNGRTEIDYEKSVELERVRLQIRQLRDEVLPALGYRNIFHEEGYEADDVIASLCQNLLENSRAVIVTADQDLLQCLDKTLRINWYNPRQDRRWTWAMFRSEYGISASKWPLVKAMAGCASDNVSGIVGIGEKTAAKYLSGKLKSGSKAYQKIKAGLEIARRNLPLVKLPFDGCPQFEVVEDKCSDRKREIVYQQYGLASLANVK